MLRHGVIGRISATVIAITASTWLASPAKAMDGSSGCGPGWYVFKDVSLVSSSLRSTTNGILFPTTTIGMTFGTSNCAQHKIVERYRQSVKFANLSYHELLVQMAEGKGEHLGAFAATLGCPWQAQAEFNHVLQAGYATILPGDEAKDGSIDAVGIVQRVQVEIARRPQLAQACQLDMG